MTEDEEFNADEKVRIAALHKTAPKKIWLQIDPEAKQFDGWDAQTWCSDQINDTDLEYARVDVVESLRQQLASRDAEVALLKADNEYLYIAAIKRDQLREQVTLLRDVLSDFDKVAINSKSIIGFAGQSFKLITKMRKALAATELSEDKEIEVPDA